MPTELLALPPAYTIVGLYRLITDPSIRDPVWAKIKHAGVRGAVAGVAYAIFSWGPMNWFVRKWVLKGRPDRRVTIGGGALALSIDLVFYTHLLILIPQVGAIMRFFMLKNLRIARSRAYNLTVASRRKPAEFWSQRYVEEWQYPPQPTPEQRDMFGRKTHREQWVKWALWWPSQFVLRHYILLPLSPTLPLLTPMVIAGLRALGTAEYLHQPYFSQKRMSPQDIWTWVEERKWAYRSFGFVAALLERLPIIGLYFSISNRVAAAMWAHDYEKRQHLFAAGILKPLPPAKIGVFGIGVDDITPEVRAAQQEIEQKWSSRPAYQPPLIDDESEAIELPPRYTEYDETSATSSAVAPDVRPPPLPQRPQAIPPPLPPRK